MIQLILMETWTGADTYDGGDGTDTLRIDGDGNKCWAYKFYSIWWFK